MKRNTIKDQKYFSSRTSEAVLDPLRFIGEEEKHYRNKNDVLRVEQGEFPGGLHFEKIDSLLSTWL